MIKEVTREVVSIEDAKEMAYDEQVLSYRMTENGYLCTFLEETAEPIIKKASKSWVVFCDTGSGRMYVTNHGTSFYACDVKHFSEYDAKTKAHFMNLNGVYNWQATAL